MPKLVLLFEGRVLKETAVSHTAAVTIGRLPDNTIVIDNSAVSSRHVRIAREGPQFVVEDLESTNGTFVNGDKVTKRALRHGLGSLAAEWVVVVIPGIGITRVGDQMLSQ